MFDFIKTFEDNLLSKKKKRKKGIENFLEEEDIPAAGEEEIVDPNLK